MIKPYYNLIIPASNSFVIRHFERPPRVCWPFESFLSVYIFCKIIWHAVLPVCHISMDRSSFENRSQSVGEKFDDLYPSCAVSRSITCRADMSDNINDFSFSFWALTGDQSYEVAVDVFKLICRVFLEKGSGHWGFELLLQEFLQKNNFNEEIEVVSCTRIRKEDVKLMLQKKFVSKFLCHMIQESAKYVETSKHVINN